VFAAVLSDSHAGEKSKLLEPKTFNLERKCMNIISMFETIEGGARPYFTHPSIETATITASEQVFDLILFLIFYDSVFGPNQVITSVSCAPGSSDEVEIRFEKLVFSSKTDRSYKFNTTDLVGNNNKSFNKVRIKPSNIDKTRQNFFDKLPPDDKLTSSDSKMVRLACQLSRKYFGIDIIELAPEYIIAHSSFVKHIYQLKLPQGVCSMTKLVDDVGSKIGITHWFPTLPKNEKKEVKIQWLLVDQQDEFSDLQKMLKSLLVPVDSCAIDNIQQQPFKFLVVVVHEALLQLGDSTIQKIKEAACKVIVVCNTLNDLNQRQELSRRYHLPIERVITNKISYVDLFSCVQIVSYSSKPRKIHLKDYQEILATLYNRMDSGANTKYINPNLAPSSDDIDSEEKVQSRTTNIKNRNYSTLTHDQTTIRWKSLVSRIQVIFHLLF
jgi:hypothetical protein